MGEDIAENQGEGAVARGLHLLSLTSFAILAPLLDVIGRDAGLLVARKVSPAEIIALICVLALAPPILLWSCERVVGLVSAAGERALHGVFVGALLLLISMPIVTRMGPRPPMDLLLIAASAALGVLLFSKFEWVRFFLAVTSLGAPVFVGLFLADESVSVLVFGSASEPGIRVTVESETPVVMVVFDELGLLSLLDASGEVDADRYPAFARLARESHWLQNASAVDWRTLQVIPAILSGRYPDMKRRLPIANEHPRNLFSLFAPNHHMNVVETHTHLFEGGRATQSVAQRAPVLLQDLALIHLHIILPKRYAERLPSVSRTWKDFGAADRPLEESPLDVESTGDRVREFRDFVSLIDGRERASLHFIHILLPHSPWQYMPAGRSYRPSDFAGTAFGEWVDEPWWAVQAQQRHLLQLEFVDSLLGELLERLDEQGIYDESLLVVTADHGVSFWPTGTYRDFARAPHPEDILSVPLFVKQPHQRKPSVRTENVETVDVLPIMLDLLDIDEPWEFDGCSIFDEDCASRPEKVAFSTVHYSSEENRRLVYPAQIGLERDGLERKIRLFGTGKQAGALFRIGPRVDLHGKRASPLLVPGAALAGNLRLSEGVTAYPLPVRLHGVLELRRSQPSPIVAVTIDDEILAVVPAVTDGRNALRKMTGHPLKRERYVSAMIPEEAASHGGRDALKLYLVEGKGRATVLRPIAIVK